MNRLMREVTRSVTICAPSEPARSIPIFTKITLSVRVSPAPDEQAILFRRSHKRRGGAHTHGLLCAPVRLRLPDLSPLAHEAS